MPPASCRSLTAHHRRGPKPLSLSCPSRLPPQGHGVFVGTRSWSFRIPDDVDGRDRLSSLLAILCLRILGLKRHAELLAWRRGCHRFQRSAIRVQLDLHECRYGPLSPTGYRICGCKFQECNVHSGELDRWIFNLTGSSRVLDSGFGRRMGSLSFGSGEYPRHSSTGVEMNVAQPSISLDRTGDAGRVWRDCCMLRTGQGRGGEWPRSISSRALGRVTIASNYSCEKLWMRS